MPSNTVDFLSQPYSSGIILNRFKNNHFDMIGDSRTADSIVSAPTIVGLQGTHWFNWANALSNNRMVLNNVFGTSGARSDEYINTYWSRVLTSDSKFLIWGFPIVNDLAQSVTGYITADGVTVNNTNVAQTAAKRIQTRILEATTSGKTVIITMEPGANNLDAATVKQLHEFNTRMSVFGRTTPGCIVWSANAVLWNPTASATVIGFRTGMLRSAGSDTTHYSVLGGYTAGTEFATKVVPNLNLPYSDMGISSINDTYGQNPRQLIRNALFNTTTGGTRTTVGGTGNIPANWTLTGAASSTVNVSSSSNANGFGNDIILDCTTTGNDTITFESVAPANADWDVTDIFDFEIEASVAVSSSNACVYSNLQTATPTGTDNWWTLYGLGFNPFPTAAYTVNLKSQAATTKAGTSKSFLSARLNIRTEGAGTAVVTVRRASCLKRLLT